MYSQNDEDDFFLEYFKDFNGGTLLEIGAYDSTTFSNSKALIEKGWSAFLVDASPFCVTKLFEAYKGNDKVNLIQSLITLEETNGLTSFFEYPFSAVSSVDKDHAKKYFIDKDEFEQNSKELLLPSIDLKTLISDVLKRSSEINFLSIDVEGFSADLAMTLDLEQVQPACICIEHDFKQNQLMSKFSPLYNIASHNGENLVLTKK